MSTQSNGHLQNGSAAREFSEKITKDSNEILHDIALQKVRDRMESLQVKLVADIDQKLGSMFDDLLGEVKRYDFQSKEIKQLFEEQNSKLNSPKRKPNQKNGALPEKEYIARNSLLTDLFEIKHIRTIYHIFVVILILLFMNTMVHDFVADGTFNLGFYPIWTGFGKFPTALALWGCMQMFVFALHFAFKMWATSTVISSKNSLQRKAWNISWLLLFISFQIGLMSFSVFGVLKFDLPAASAIALLMEMIRFLMKCHAFIRTNVPRVMIGKLKNDDNDMKPPASIPKFSAYAYFLFAPALVYRDNYPRNKVIRWRFVARHMMEVLLVIFYISFIFERFLMPYFRKFGDSNIAASDLVLSIFGCMMPGTISFLCGFFCLLHSWMNASAEMLRFADRMFYKDWWNAPSFADYYRTWNVVVHDWLYTYVYKDVYEILLPGSKVAAALIVFTISAVVHEFILAVSFRFLYPVMFVLFEGAGVMLMFGTKRKHKDLGNIIMWLSLCVGNGLLLSLYTMEFFARQNCPVDDTIWGLITPVSWSCHGIADNKDWKIKAPWK